MAKQPDWMNLPNRITIARLLIAALLFLFLSLELQYGFGRHLSLNVAAGIFVICVATDWLDGWLARRHGLVTTFGRIADPFVDKVVVCGTFIYLVLLAPTLMKPSYAVVMVAREFLVTSLRSHLEGLGIEFGARLGGKLKMVLQSVTIPLILLYQANLAAHAETRFARGAYDVAVVLILLTVLATLLSAWDYIVVAWRGLHRDRGRSS